MSGNERDAGLRQAFQDLAERAGPGRDCPGDERIWRAVAGDLSSEETIDVVEHTGTCPVCAETWRLAHALGSAVAEEGPVPAIDAGRKRRPSAPWTRYLALAATLAAAAVLVTVVIQFRPETAAPPDFRTLPEQEIRSLLPRDAPVPRDACVLQLTQRLQPGRWARSTDLNSLGPLVVHRPRR